MTKRSQATLSRLIKNTLARPAFAQSMPSMIAIAVLLVAANSASALPMQEEAQKNNEDATAAKQEAGSKEDTKPSDTKTKDTTDKPKNPEPKPPTPRETKLLEQDFTKTWKLYAAEEGVKVQDVWKINKTESGNILVCTGKPKGYLRTTQELSDYTLSFEFRYPMDENGNSGVLLHIDGKDKIWPDGIQVQLHRPTAGSIFPSGNRKTRFTIGAKLELNLNKWNKCQIDVRKDTVEVRLNDIAVGPIKYCNPASGFVALQSEGSEVHFRNLKLTQYTAAPVEPPSVAAKGGNKPAEPREDAEPTRSAEVKPPATKPAPAPKDSGTEIRQDPAADN